MPQTRGMPTHFQLYVLEKAVRALAVDFPRLDAKVVMANSDVWFDSTLTYAENKEQLADHLSEHWSIPRAAVLTQADMDAEQESRMGLEARVIDLRGIIGQDPGYKQAVIDLACEFGVELAQRVEIIEVMAPAKRARKTREQRAERTNYYVLDLLGLL